VRCCSKVLLSNRLLEVEAAPSLVLQNFEAFERGTLFGSVNLLEVRIGHLLPPPPCTAAPAKEVLKDAPPRLDRWDGKAFKMEMHGRDNVHYLIELKD